VADIVASLGMEQPSVSKHLRVLRDVGLVQVRRDGRQHTYSAYGRGLDILIGAYNFLDLAPKGRDEEGLAFSMAWVRHHDQYADGYFVDPEQLYSPPEKTADACCSGEKHS
jgi:DNA-binding transcriptional ArsR family regulator